MNIHEFDYNLPSDLIAQNPVEPRDHSRLMYINRQNNEIKHFHFYDLPDLLNKDDVLVFNNSRVIPARLFGYTDEKKRVELLLLKKLPDGTWKVLARPARKLHIGQTILVKNGNPTINIVAQIKEKHGEGIHIVELQNEHLIDRLGKTPLPPYIRNQRIAPERYQTIYAKVNGSAAAPTAGLHFTNDLLMKLSQLGIQLVFVTLHIGLDTFRPIYEENPSEHKIHSEYGELNQETADLLNEAKKQNKRIIAVGTSTVRILEAASQTDIMKPICKDISLFILPGYKFKTVNGLITNFHLPKSTLLLLVSAFAGKDLIFKAYEQAIKLNYRFYSFGDAMLII